MPDSNPLPSLKALHPESSLNAVKLAKIDQLSTADLLASLMPGRGDYLKARPDGTILDGHHRLFVLKQRGVSVDSLPREVIEKKED